MTSDLETRTENLLQHVQELETRVQNLQYALMRRDDVALAQRCVALLQALGVLTTLHPTLQIDVDNPIEMAREIHRYVTAQLRPAPAVADVAAIVDNTPDAATTAQQRAEQLAELREFMGPFNADERARPTHAVWQDRADVLAQRLHAAIQAVGPLPYVQVSRS